MNKNMNYNCKITWQASQNYFLVIKSRPLKFLGELLSEMHMVACLIIYVDVNKKTQVQMHAQLTQISCDESETYCNE